MPQDFVNQLKERGDGSDHDLLLLIAYEQTMMKANIEELKVNVLARVDQNTEDLNDLKQFQRDFNFRWKFVVAIASGISATVGFLLSTLSNAIGLWG